MTMLIDLHTHSTASDGQHRPAELVGMAKAAGIQLYALTDHDTVDGLEEAGDTANELGVKWVSGIEISTQDVEEIHILGYGIDHHNERLVAACRKFRSDRNHRGERIRDYLAGIGIEIDLDEVRAGVQGNLGRPHFAKYLVKHGVVSSTEEAFTWYLDTPAFKTATDRKKPSCGDAIELIHDAGGLAVLAHPGHYRMDREELSDLIGRLVGFGLDGIECFYYRHSEEQTEFCLEQMRRYGLKTGCGSDFHGESVKPGIPFGMEYDEKTFGNNLIC